MKTATRPMTTHEKIRRHLNRFGEMPPAQQVAWLGHALVLLLEAELDRAPKKELAPYPRAPHPHPDFD